MRSNRQECRSLGVLGSRSAANQTFNRGFAFCRCERRKKLFPYFRREAWLRNCSRSCRRTTDPQSVCCFNVFES